MIGTTPMSPDIIAALEQRVRAHGTAPLLTWYGPADERVELSGITVANWADKIANLLDEEGYGPGDALSAPLLAERPCHWTSLVWLLGALQMGMTVTLDGSGDVSVVGPGGDAEAELVIECCLHPLGLGGDVAPGHTDFGDVRLQPDLHQRRPWNPSSLPVTVEARADRRVVTPDEPWATLVDAVLAPVLGGGSTVLVEGSPDDERLSRISAAERVSSAVV